MDPTSNVAQAHAEPTPTEQAAQRRIAPHAGKLRGRVLAAVAAAGEDGLTALEVTQVLGYGIEKLYSCAPRLPELERDGYVRKGPVRDDRVAYVATAAGHAWAEREVAA